MKKYVFYLLCIAMLPIVSSCSKEEKAPDLIPGEAKIHHETGLSFITSSGFDADQVVFKLKARNGMEKEYGQSLSGFNFTKLNVGAKTIYQIQVSKKGAAIPFKAYTLDSDSNRKEVKATSIIKIKDGEILNVALEKIE